MDSQMTFFGGRQGLVERSPPRRRALACPSKIAPLLLDTLYLGGLAVTLPYLIARGRGAHVLDHIRRRTQSLPLRGGRRPCVWVHGVSVGEILSVRRFLARFSLRFPAWEIVLSTTTRAGLEAGRRQYRGQQVLPYPFDFSPLVRRAFDRLRPDLVVIAEHELWPNFLWHAQKRNVPVCLVNGRLSSRSLDGYKLLSRVIEWPPSAIELYCVEDQLSAERFLQLGVRPDRIHVTDNLKFDAQPYPAGVLREELGLSHRHWVVVGASVHDSEEHAVLQAFASLHRDDKNVRLLIAPRRLDRIEKLVRAICDRGFRVTRWSQLADDRTARSTALNGAADVLLVDTFGDLPRLVSVGDAIFVGGSLVPFGGHNIIEPARNGRPVVIGPHYENFHDVVQGFLENDALMVCQNGDDLGACLATLKRDPARAAAMARRAAQTVARRSGSSSRTLQAMRPLVAMLEERVRSNQTCQPDTVGTMLPKEFE